MFRIYLIFTIFITSALAGEIRLTLENAPDYALRQNADLAAARLRIDEARGRLNQSGRFSNPEVEVDINRNIHAPEGSVGVTLMQKFPLTGRLRLEKAVTRAELAAAEAEVRNAERKLVAEVRTAVVKLLSISGQQSLRARQLGNSRELSDFTRKRLETGEASLVDASLVDLEAQQLQTEILQFNVERTALLGDLRPLLGIRATNALIITGTLPAIGALVNRGVSLEARPDFQAAQSMADAARQSEALARAQKWEDLGVGLNMMRERTEDAPEGFETDTFIGLRLNLPLPFWNNNSGRIQEASAAAARSEKEIDALTITIHSEITSAREQMTALAKLVIALDADLLPKSSEIEEQLRLSYASGQTALTEVLRARDRRLLIERQRIDALRDYHLARVRYLAATGQPTLSTNPSK